MHTSVTEGKGLQFVIHSFQQVASSDMILPREWSVAVYLCA